MAIIALPYMYVPNPKKGQPLFNGKIYIGNQDTDPTIPEHQKESLLIQENGNAVPAEYPILTNSGGVPVYNGSPVAIDVTGTYSIAIHDKDDQQVYYFANAGEFIEFLTTDLRSIMFMLGLTYADIGVKLIVDETGTSLDGAEYILNTTTGEVWKLPYDIPLGATIVELSGSTLTTSVGQFELSRADRPVTNRLKGNQNLNIEGPDDLDLPSSTPTSYPTPGEQFAAGWYVGTAIVDMTYTDGIIEATSGSYYRLYGGDRRNDYNVVKLSDDSTSTEGVEVTFDGTNTKITVDFSGASPVGPHKFPQMSEQKGTAPDISDNDSIDSYLPIHQRTKRTVDQLASRNPGVVYTNTSEFERELNITFANTAAGAGSVTGFTLNAEGFDFLAIQLHGGGGQGTQHMSLTKTVAPGEDYIVSIAQNSTKSTWLEK